MKAYSGAEAALAAISESRPDVLVSDIGMPGEDGYAFIRELRARPAERGGRVPAVAVTAYARPDDRRRALSAGFDAHLTKPIDEVELVAVIASLSPTKPAP